jgi:hypothetical protein
MCFSEQTGKQRFDSKLDGAWWPVLAGRQLRVSSLFVACSLACISQWKRDLLAAWSTYVSTLMKEGSKLRLFQLLGTIQQAHSSQEASSNA